MTRDDTFAKVSKSNLSLFFFLEEKETKIQGERPTTICPAVPKLNGGSLSFAKSSRTITNVCVANAVHKMCYRYR
ncbi:MAG: hypothetical protein IPL10_09190 [Bacteroidetes bacterium]|nr:hypothetical protein [Bacteroidota bacterium]